jgi:hypothetical protein
LLDNLSEKDNDGPMRRRAALLLATAFVALASLASASAQAGPAQHTVWATARVAAVAPACRSGYYKNVSDHCVRSPMKATSAPAGATAKCRDNTYSFSQHASGTCSHHGGVGRWIHHP